MDSGGYLLHNSYDNSLNNSINTFIPMTPRQGGKAFASGSRLKFVAAGKKLQIFLQLCSAQALSRTKESWKHGQLGAPAVALVGGGLSIFNGPVIEVFSEHSQLNRMCCAF